jgi:hypothetical protein
MTPSSNTRARTERTETPTTRTGRPLSSAEQDLRLFGQIDSRWRRLASPLSQRWQLERMAADLGLILTEAPTDG